MLEPENQFLNSHGYQKKSIPPLVSIRMRRFCQRKRSISGQKRVAMPRVCAVTRSVLRRPAPFVALVRSDREFVRLVNRAALLEEMAISLGEEPETNHA